MDPDRLRAVAGTPEAKRDDDALLARMVDDLLDTGRIAHVRVAAFRALAGKAALLDLIATVGFYTTLGAMLTTFDVPLDAGIEPTDIPT